MRLKFSAWLTNTSRLLQAVETKVDEFLGQASEMRQAHLYFENFRMIDSQETFLSKWLCHEMDEAVVNRLDC